ncbi:6320_t:CDS:1 [Ambispora leptoticha]|uniref:6320_t:CDS:1 n=1 Tax=Ambispora leptoticha TaxID=144679 RepID=A0A9N9AZT2_9GLOM|nr:6320_t:CDS:1 [Ambispora leptoticha]
MFRPVVVLTKQNPRGSKPPHFQNLAYTTASSNTPGSTGSDRGRGRGRGRGSNSGPITVAGKTFDISPATRKKIEVDNARLNNLGSPFNKDLEKLTNNLKTAIPPPLSSTQQFEDAEESVSKGRPQQSKYQKMRQNNKISGRDNQYTDMIVSLVKGTIMDSKNTEKFAKTKGIPMKSPWPDKKQKNADELLSIISDLASNEQEKTNIEKKKEIDSQPSSIALPKSSVSDVSLKQDQEVPAEEILSEIYQLAVTQEGSDEHEDDEAKKTWQAKITARKKKISSATIVPHARRQFISDEIQSIKLKTKPLEDGSIASSDVKKEESMDQQSKDNAIRDNNNSSSISNKFADDDDLEIITKSKWKWEYPTIGIDGSNDDSPILLDPTVKNKISSNVWKWDRNKAAELFPDFSEPISDAMDSGEAQKQWTRNKRLNQMSGTFDQPASIQYDRTRDTYPRRGGYDNRGRPTEGNRNQFRGGGGMNRQSQNRRPTSFRVHAQLASPENLQFTSTVKTEFDWSQFDSKYPPVKNYFLKSAAKLSPIERTGLKLEIIGGDYLRYLSLSPSLETVLKEINERQRESIEQTVKSMNILLDNNTSYSYSIDKKAMFLGTFIEGMQGRFRTLLPPTEEARKTARK